MRPGPVRTLGQACGLLLAIAACLPAQHLFDAAPGHALRFQPSDRAVLAGDGNRDDLPCRVTPQQPHLGFDLKFTTGYVVQLAADSVVRGGDELRVLFRVRPVSGPDRKPTYFRQSFRTPSGSSEGGGKASFPGRFVVGPGQYEIDWLMRNRSGRVCSSHWTASARLPPAMAGLAGAAPANHVAPFSVSTFAEAPPVARWATGADGLHVSLLVNLAPLERDRFKLSDHEVECVAGMLRSLHAEPRFAEFSLIAFNAYDRQLVYEVRNQPRLDFRALGDAIEATPAGVVDLEELADPDGERRFLAEVLARSLAPGPHAPDALVIMGPKVDREAGPGAGELTLPARPAVLHQFAFHRNPQSYPWSGAIEAFLQPHGLTVSTVSRAQEFARALASFLLKFEDPGNPDLEP